MNTKLVVLLALFGLTQAGGRVKQKVDDINLYDQTKTSIVNYTKLNFNAQVTSNRKASTSVVHYYKKDDGKSESEIKQEYIDFAEENAGVFRSGAVNCDEWIQICQKEGIKTYPTVKIYPPLPIPILDYDLNEKFTNKDLRKKLSKFVVDKSTEITQTNIKMFLEEDIQTPKVLLFTKAPKGTPWVYKVLSQHFEKTLQFGLVRSTEEALAKQYKIKSWPAMFVVKAEGKPIKFEGKEKTDFTYNNMFEFINVHSQIFVDPNSVESQSTVKKSSAAKPWLVKPVAQLTKESGNDLCLQKDGSLCIVLVAKDAAAVQQQHLDALHSISQGFASKISRGITFIVSYLIADDEPEFTKKFNLESHDKPQIVILNPGKRKRFLLHEGDISEAHLEKTLDKILGGDARFKNIKGNELPKLVSSWPEEQK